LNHKEQMGRLSGRESEDCRREVPDIIAARGKALMLGGTAIRPLGVTTSRSSAAASGPQALQWG